jgi:hypothetical protein
VTMHAKTRCDSLKPHVVAREQFETMKVHYYPYKHETELAERIYSINRVKANEPTIRVNSGYLCGQTCSSVRSTVILNTTDL